MQKNRANCVFTAKVLKKWYTYTIITIKIENIPEQKKSRPWAAL
jgi:hypothetical protein